MWYNTEFKVTPDPDAPNNWINIWEPLKTAAPKDAKPYCCYIRTIIFYKDMVGGERLDQIGTIYDNLGTRWTTQDIGWACLEPFVKVGEDYYLITCGSVVWKDEDGGWFMQWSAKRARPEHYQTLQHWLDHKEEVEAFVAEIKERIASK